MRPFFRATLDCLIRNEPGVAAAPQIAAMRGAYKALGKDPDAIANVAAADEMHVANTTPSGGIPACARIWGFTTMM